MAPDNAGRSIPFPRGSFDFLWMSQGQERSALTAHRRSKAWQAALQVLQKWGPKVVDPSLAQEAGRRQCSGGRVELGVELSKLLAHVRGPAPMHGLRSWDLWGSEPRVPQASVQPTVQSISQSIAAARPEWQAALLLLERAPLDVVCCNGALAALARGAQWQPAFEALKQWTRLGLRASTVTFTTLLGACGARWRLALEVLGEMPERKLEAMWRRTCFNSNDHGMILDDPTLTMLTQFLDHLDGNPS